MSIHRVTPAILLSLSATSLLAQTPPCGQAVVAVTDNDSPKEERFLAAAPEHVKACTLRALPAVGANLEWDHGLELKAKIGRFGMWQVWLDTNKKAGVKGAMAGTVIGSYAIRLGPETRDGIEGTLTSIEFDKWGMGGSKKGATQLMQEIACLSGLLGQSDPVAHPRGPSSVADSTDGRVVTLPEGTPIQVILRDPLYSKEIAKQEKGTQIVLEVAADVGIDGVTLIRKGALALGGLADSAKGAGRFGKSADLAFVIQRVTTIDGQSVPVMGAMERRGQRDVPANYGVGGLPLLMGFLTKGLETVVRAGTTYEVEVSGTHAIKVGQ